MVANISKKTYKTFSLYLQAIDTCHVEVPCFVFSVTSRVWSSFSECLSAGITESYDGLRAKVN